MENYPLEVRVTPVPVVALVGQGKIHGKIKLAANGFNMKALSYRMNDPIAFSKPPKRLSYEGYEAKGILKANWMYKMVNAKASAVGIVIPWCDKDGRDEEGHPWHTREPDLLQCYSYVQKNYQHFRTPNHIVFFIVLPSGLSLNETHCLEKIGIFRKKIELSEKFFFFLSEDDFSSGNSLNNALSLLKELASSYYLEEARRLKKEKDTLSRRAQPLVFVRHHWKVAFLSEFRNDTHGIIKYYTAAYGYLRDVPKEYFQEVKIIADYTNLKLCTIFLRKYGVPEAVGQFQRHMKNYKHLYSVLPYESEHWGWVSRQYQVLGELLQEYAPTTLWVSCNPSYSHPAFYFHAAASYAKIRKRKAFEMVDGFKPELLEKFKSLKPLQLASIDRDRQVFVGKVPNENVEYQKEEEELSFEEWKNIRRFVREYNVPHSRTILDLLQKAHGLYSTRVASGSKIVNCKRIKLLLIFEMGEESFDDNHFDKAKEYYDILRNSLIQKEEWKHILTNVYQRSLACAFKLQQTEDIINLILALCEKDIPLSIKDKQENQTQLLRILYHNKDIDLPKLSEPIIIKPLSAIHSLLDINCQFHQEKVYVQNELKYRIQFISKFPNAIRFNKLNAQFSDSSYNVEIIDDKDYNMINTEDGLVLYPGVPRTFDFSKNSSTTGEVKFENIQLSIGSDDVCIEFDWDVNEWNDTTVNPNSTFSQRLVTKICEEEPKVSIGLKHLPPLLVNEFYRIVLQLKNDGEDVIEGSLLFSNILKDDTEFNCKFYNTEFKQIESYIQVDSISSKETKNVTFYILSRVDKPQKINIQFLYRTEKYSTEIKKAITIPSTLAVSSRCAFFNNKYSPCSEVTGNNTTIRMNEPWSIRVDITNKSIYPIEVVDSFLKLNENAKLLSSTSSQLFKQKCILQSMDKLTCWFKIIPQTAGIDIIIGKFKIKWKRSPHDEQLEGAEEDNERIVLSSTLIPSLTIIHPQFSTNVIAPSEGTVGLPFQCILEIINSTPRVEEFSFSLSDTTNFLIAGSKASSFKIMPYHSYQFISNMIPLKSGKIELPSYQIASKRFAQPLSCARQKHFIFVTPPGF